MNSYKQKDELAEMFSKRNAVRPAVHSEKPAPKEERTAPKSTGAKKPHAPVRAEAKKADKAKKRRNLMIANGMIYGGIFILVVLCIVVAVAFATASNGEAITSIRFANESVTVKTGQSEKLKVITEPKGVEYAMSFRCTGDAVSVSSDGTVTALKPGTSVVTVESSGLTARCTITVNADTITAIFLEETSVEIGGGEEYACHLSFAPENAADRDIYWQTSDIDVATVDKNGVIKGMSSGTVTITVTDRITGLTKSVEVTVKGTLLPESMVFSESSITLEKGETYTAQLILTPSNIIDKSAIYYTTDISVASVTNEGVITAKGEGTCTIEAWYKKDFTVVAYLEVNVIDPYVITGPSPDISVPNPEKPTGPSVPGMEVIDGITYVNGILIANKTYGLPSTYDPGTDDDAYNALYEMERDAAAQGIILYLNSGYRDYDTQDAIYNRYVADDGKEAADRYSARPGHSEHQTGLAFDLNSFEESSGETREGRWLAENCHKYGFIIRYPKDKEHITGYIYEPWHVRYLGVETATAVYNSGLCLEEYLGITSKYKK
ncbi:MAG: D-alanyl-D-alanine carboxypeptidase family protein [Ruminiclostridium sp.]|nr:D-alanyl-D-alanine carboxypeptidase family protein [Ruminiclostridium sp.]